MMDIHIRRGLAAAGAAALVAAALAVSAPAAAVPSSGDDAKALIWDDQKNPYASSSSLPPLATTDGALWVVDENGGAARRAPDGSWAHYETLPGVDDRNVSYPVTAGTAIAYATGDGTHDQVMQLAADGTATEVTLPSGTDLYRVPFASDATGGFWFSVTGATETLVHVTGGGSVVSPLAGEFVDFAAADDGGAWVVQDPGIQHVAADGVVTTVALPAGQAAHDVSPATGGAAWFTASVGTTGAAIGLVQPDGTVTEKVLNGVIGVTLHIIEPQAPSALTWVTDGAHVYYGTSPSTIQAVTALFPSADRTMVRSGDQVVVADYQSVGNAISTITPDGAVHLHENVSGPSLVYGVAGPDGTTWLGAGGSGPRTQTVAISTDGSFVRGAIDGFAVPATFTPDGKPWFATEPGIATPHTASVDRIGGDTRYDAAVAIAQAAFPTGAPVVYIASGASYPDALSAGPAAAQDGGPLLLTPPDRLPSAVAAEISSLDPDRIVVVGGPASVSDAVEQTLRGLAPTVTRVGGADRYAVSRDLVSAHQQTGKPLFVATGAGFADAVTAGAAAARAGGQLLLVPGNQDALPTVTTTLIANLHPSSIAVVGGPASVSNAIFIELDGQVPSTRYGGADRYAVSAAVTTAFGSPSDHVYLTTGANFPDALAAGPLAGRAGATLISVPGTCVPAVTRLAVDGAAPTAVTLLGGTESVGTDVSWLRGC